MKVGAVPNARPAYFLRLGNLLALDELEKSWMTDAENRRRLMS